MCIVGHYVSLGYLCFEWHNVFSMKAWRDGKDWVLLTSWLNDCHLEISKQNKMVSFTRAEFIRLSFWLLVFLMPLFIRLNVISAYFFFFLTINTLLQNNQLPLNFFFFNYKQNRLAFSSFSVYSHVAFSNLVVIFLALPCSLLIFLIPFLKFVCGSMYLIFHLTEATYESSNASRILLVGNTSEQL